MAPKEQGEEPSIDKPSAPSTSRSLEPFSLPSRPPGHTATLDIDDSELPDWLKTGETGVPRKNVPAADTEEPAHHPEDDLPDWLLEAESADAILGGKEVTTDELFAALAGKTDAEESGELPAWLANLNQSNEEEELPEWLQGLVMDRLESRTSAEDLDPDAIPDWLGDLQRMDRPKDSGEVSEQDAGLTDQVAEEVEHSPADQGAPLAQDAGGDEEIPDWLTEAMAGKEVSEEPAEAADQGASAEASKDETFFPDTDTEEGWAVSDTSSAGETDTDDQDQDELPDWLGVITESDFGDETEEPEIAEQDRSGAFLGLATAASGFEDAGTDPADEEDARAEDELPDWLGHVELEDASLTTDSDTLQAPQVDWSDVAEAGEDAPQDLGSGAFTDDERYPATDSPFPIADASDATVPAYPAEEEVPDWLRDVEVDVLLDDTWGDLAAAATSAAVMASEIQSGWLGALPIEEGTQQEDNEELPDWLREFDADDFSVGDDESEGDADLPAWLRSESQAKPEIVEPEEPDLPEWLGGAPETAEEPEIDEPDDLLRGAAAGAMLAAGAELPEWLAGTGDEPFETAQPTESTESQEDELPSWLQELEASETEAPAPTDDADALPDWLGGIVAPVDEDAADHAEAGEEQAKSGAGEDDDDDESDWSGGLGAALGAAAAGQMLSDVDAASAPAEEDAQDEATSEPEEDDRSAQFAAEHGIASNPFSSSESAGTPEWVYGNSEELLGFEPEAESDPPDWLDLANAEGPLFADVAWQTAAAEAPVDLGGDEDFPGLLEAMRPGDLAPVDGLDSVPEPEAFGPLAGLTGILKPEDAAIGPATDEQLAQQLLVTPEQKRQAALFRQLSLPAENMLERTDRVRPGVLGTPVRVVLALLLLAVVVGGLLTQPFIETVLPEAPAVLDARAAIGAVTNETVLVAFEYTPAFAGELNPAAVALLTDLAAQDTPVILVSQSPTGIALGEQIASEIDGLTSTSLGYLPGESVGLRLLAGCLRDNAVCDDPLLQGASGLEDITLAVVLASEQTGLVGWIEQVQVQTDVPLVAGVTQALYPLALPYLQSGQLAGLINGLPGVAQYEQAAPLNQAAGGPASDQLWAFTLAQWLAILVLVAGNLYWLLQSRTSSGLKMT